MTQPLLHLTAAWGRRAAGLLGLFAASLGAYAQQAEPLPTGARPVDAPGPPAARAARRPGRRHPGATSSSSPGLDAGGPAHATAQPARSRGHRQQHLHVGWLHCHHQ
ncbi:hypothetical protein [Hymenobacter crusticola]|uniref:hypothetical protein n=1 Tax=Hymenobacter crusticola TaxID=1770526 RepID=UPI0015C4F1D0|nr:hypothetical protein [Hymenobacter crusticola]